MYILKYEINGSDRNILNLYNVSDKWSIVPEKISDFPDLPTAEAWYTNYMTTNNMEEITETQYNLAINKELVWNSGISVWEAWDFNNLDLEEQRAYVLHIFRINLEYYSTYLILEDDYKTDVKNLRKDIKDATSTAELLTAIAALETLISDIENGV